VPIKIHLGEQTTHGRGAGNDSQIGKESAIEAINEIEKILADNTQMVFITAGMGGGTGTGAAPIIAKTAKELGILTVAIVTVPFRFEGRHRVNQAIEGLDELKENVDSLLVINNEKLREMFGNLSLTDAFVKADDVLAVAAKGIAEIITVPGKVNVDFADVSTVMSNSGVAIMGSSTSSGENRAVESISQALVSPLLNNADIVGAKNILLNFTSGNNEITMDEMTEITDFIIDSAGDDVNMIWGSVKDESLGDELRVTIIATGFEMDSLPDLKSKKTVDKKERINLGSAERKDIPQETKIVEPAPEYIVQEPVELNHTTQTEIDFSVDDDPEIRLINTSNRDEGKEGEISNSTSSRTEGQASWKWGEVKEKEDITAWEKVPAFMRKKKQFDIEEEAEESNDDGNEVSRFRLSDDGDGIQLSDNNSFLEDNVD
jgi:cell division protein FtsZ